MNGVPKSEETKEKIRLKHKGKFVLKSINTLESIFVNKEEAEMYDRENEWFTPKHLNRILKEKK